MIKDIVVALGVGSANDPARDYAISVAAEFGAQIAAVGFAYEPIVPPVDMGSAIPIDLIDEQRETNTKAAKDAIAAFESAARQAGLSPETRLIDASAAGAASAFASIARSFDLAVVGQSGPGTARDDMMIEASLFESGRPVLVVPYIQRTGLKLGRVAACWDGSRNAARAINDAMPFLSRAKAVDVVTVTGENDKTGSSAAADIVRHLAHHGAKAEVRTVTAGGVDVANAILSDAADRGTDFIVMGGYGHSRLREFVLGGATRGILATMTVPVLMSH